MPAHVNVDVIPQVARPDAVTAALAETVELRDRSRQAQEQGAAAQAQLDELERQDVEQAAQRARTGEPLGTTPVAVKKAREALEQAKRTAAAIALALEGAEGDLGDALNASTPAWLAALDDETERARQRAATALTEFEAALDDLTAATSSSLWLRSAQDDQRWDRAVSMASAGSSAPSSRRQTANGEALRRYEIVAYCRELVEAPPQRPAS
jgi:hypothetical protein